MRSSSQIDYRRRNLWMRCSLSINKSKNLLNFNVVEQREYRRNVRIKKHTQKKGREKMVVKIPDPIPRTRPSAEPPTLFPPGEALKFSQYVNVKGPNPACRKRRSKY